MGLPKPEHHPEGNPCAKCGRPPEGHRTPRSRPGRERDDDRTDAERCVFLGIDGEGQGRHPHVYTMMGCADEEGERTYVVRPKRPTLGLSTVECLEFILSIPTRHTKLFAYSFGYDLTMLLRDVHDGVLYRLFRPDLRKGEHGPKPVWWATETAPNETTIYSLNLLATRFSVAKSIPDQFRYLPNGRKIPVFGPRQVIHDVWKFFQGRFTVALKDWKVGDPEAIKRMERMKSLRSEFDKISPEEVEAYCLEECRYMAELARKLTDAHEKAGLKLRSYFGAGSSASAIMEKMGIKDHVKEGRAVRRSLDPRELDLAISSAFFGGRFENSRVGKIAGPVHGYDISSAYPFEIVFLPCLIHGKWQRTRRRAAIDSARTAIVRYKLHEPPKHLSSWAPFPFRLPDGSICYPASSGGGWVCKEEYLAGERIFPNVQFQEAWIYDCDCKCQPFAEIPYYYRERVRIGKEGPGIVIKLGCNSCYGKMAQNNGGPGTFTVWLWADLITSGTRAKLLNDGIGWLALHSDPANLLMTATDGIACTEEIDMPVPKDTGTYDCVTKDGKRVPLGGWEYKELKGGIFLARPGIYFEPRDVDGKELEYVRGRGVGRAAMLKHHQRIIDAYESGAQGVDVTALDRFVGAKTSISRRKRKDTDPGRGPWAYRRSIHYGDWIDRPIDMTFNPLPKREGEIGPGGVLKLRSFPNLTSLPYETGVGLDAEDAQALRAALEEAMEQPDVDLTDYSGSLA